MDSAHPLPTPDAGSHQSNTPILPHAPARPSPHFERRTVDVSLPARPPEPRTPMRTYKLVLLGLAAAAVGGWFALAEYIYG